MATLGSAGTDAGLEQAWQQVAGLRPRLAPHVETSQHSYRGERWLVLSDRMSGAHFRCDSEIDALLARLDGSSTVADAYEEVEQRNGGLDRFELLRLLAELQSAQLLLDLAPRDSLVLLEQQQLLRRKRWLRRLASPLAVQLPLLDPDRLLAVMAGRLGVLFQPLTLWCWLLLVGLAGILALEHRESLALHWDMRFLDPGNLLLLWLLFPLVKGIHELGHGIATRVWGGEVHEMGIMLLVFTPVPYVDASASTAFPRRERRMVVAAAGIIVELLLAALAMLLWLASEPGLLRDACFNVMIIGGLSTLLFNGNPLLRFDGYYVLTDFLEMPNLRARAQDHLGALLKVHLLGMKPAPGKSPTGREQAWLLLYAVLSSIYRLFIGLTIALFVAGKYFFIDTALALMLLLNQVLLPLLRMLTSMWEQSGKEALRGRYVLVVGSSSLLVTVLLFAVPVHNSTRAEGIVKLPENTELRTHAGGFVETIYKRDGDRVAPGELLVKLSNPELATEEAVLAARARELAVRFNDALSGERVELAILKSAIAANEAELREVREQLAHLEVRSPSTGTVALPRVADLPGRFLDKGALVGHVLGTAPPSVRVVLAQNDVDRVRRQTRDVQVRLASRLTETIGGQPLREITRATSELPSAMLGSQGGGDIAVDARDRDGRLATRPVFQLDIALPRREDASYLGQTAFVRFEHDQAPLGVLWYRQFRQHLLTQLGI